MASFKTLDALAPKGKRVLVRVDLNVPMADGKITDLTRIERVAPTMTEPPDTMPGDTILTVGSLDHVALLAAAYGADFARRADAMFEQMSVVEEATIAASARRVRIAPHTSWASSGVATSPVPIAQTGSYATTTVRAWPLHDVTALNRDPASYWPEPHLALEPDPSAGPILVTAREPATDPSSEPAQIAKKIQEESSGH